MELFGTVDDSAESGVASGVSSFVRLPFSIGSKGATSSAEESDPAGSEQTIQSPNLVCSIAGTTVKFTHKELTMAAADPTPTLLSI
mmetsp:Transcript_32242/g.74070  ORF Transcript_32242/g.74070 Transcript_32242/m.74070 type:complete len:86 (-) Transcript_32242:156-413(-)